MMSIMFFQGALSACCGLCVIISLCLRVRSVSIAGLSAVVFGFPVHTFGGRRSVVAMAVYHTVTVFVLKLAR